MPLLLLLGQKYPFSTDYSFLTHSFPSKILFLLNGYAQGTPHF